MSYISMAYFIARVLYTIEYSHRLQEWKTSFSAQWPVTVSHISWSKHNIIILNQLWRLQINKVR